MQKISSKMDLMTKVSKKWSSTWLQEVQIVTKETGILKKKTAWEHIHWSSCCVDSRPKYVGGVFFNFLSTLFLYTMMYFKNRHKTSVVNRQTPMDHFYTVFTFWYFPFHSWNPTNVKVAPNRLVTSFPLHFITKQCILWVREKRTQWTSATRSYHQFYTLPHQDSTVLIEGP